MSPSRGAFFVAGLNAHGQLDPNSTDDVYEFRELRIPLEDDEEIEEPQMVFVGWSQTVCKSIKDPPCWMSVRIDTSTVYEVSRIICYGHNSSETNLPTTEPLKLAFGNHNSLLGALDDKGNLYRYTYGPISPDSEPISTLALASEDEDNAPRLSLLAITASDRVSLTFIQAPNARLTHVLEFESYANFSEWYVDPSSESARPAGHHMLPGRAKQLVAGIASFALLMETGEVYSWGDGRYRSLGRRAENVRTTTTKTGGEQDQDGEKETQGGPQLVEAVGGLRVSKIVVGGWVMGAIVEAAGAGYLWGAAGMPGSEGQIKVLEGLESGEAALIEVGDDGEGGPLDVVDLAIGAGHVVVLCEGGKVFAVGENGNGQLGTGAMGQRYHAEWIQVRDGGIHRVLAGPKATFLSRHPA